MIGLSATPSLNQLYTFIPKVSGYPVSVKQLVYLAKTTHAPKEVVDFYKSFGADRVFKDEEDLTACSEQVEIIRREQSEMPWEIERAPEDY